ncbi:Hsp70 family protein [Dactylosporangium aurantiacum]|uniref:Hsp70 family protein n=1 Tax=Dactylosporangium aurantiacum TaxID=35754 RepID=UPI000694E7BC|nr:Hsp70 family protein [Dactylosporangium aurantiacum]MDG6106004.1 Hsp70 family protein [Dactylosporangium aurantiacum]
MVALGVDFGTSHTVAVARWPDGRARPLLFDGTPLLPSATFWDDGAVVVGRDAVHSARRAPASFEPNPKRRIDDGHVFLGDREVPVHDLLVAVFQRVRAEFVRTAGGPPASITVTHPANWASTRRKALAAAVRDAELPDATLVPEPVAAATYFVRVLRHLVPVGSAVVVYDLGAGTFDGSVVARTPEGFEVLAVDGRDDLGGLDFDEVVLAMIGRTLPAERWQRLLAPSTVEEARAARALRDEVREAKERLSRTSSVTVLVPLLDVDVQLTREEFDTAARPLVERSVRVLTETVRLSRVTPERVAGIFLVGGASQIPLVATELHRAFGTPPVTIEQPEMVVAEGSVLVGARVDRPAVPAARPRSSGGAAGRAVVPAVAEPVPRPSGAVPAVPLLAAAPALSAAAPPVVAPGPAVVPGAPPGSPAGPPVSPAAGPAGVAPVSGGRAPVSPGAVPVSPVPFSPAPPARRMPPPLPYPPPPRPVYYQPPPPAVVYVPQYVPFVPPPPRRIAPGTVRWPAGFLTLYGVLMYISTAIAGVVLIAAKLPRSDLRMPERDWNIALYGTLATLTLAVLFTHGARRLRRGGNGHLWYPMALCLLVAAGAAFTASESHQPAWFLLALVYLGSALLLLLPGARAWVSPPRVPAPPSPSVGNATGAAEA